MSAVPEPPSGLATVPVRPGLRERKKARTRAAIREHAIRLIRSQGYDATTVEQICEAAEVSPSTFFRYFPTKEDVVLQDDMELLWADALRAQPPGVPPLTALRRAVLDAFSGLSGTELEALRWSTELTLSTPALRARMMDEFARTLQVIAGMLAERAGRSADDRAVRTIAGAIMGVAMTAWFASNGELSQFSEEFIAALAFLEEGLTL